MENVNCLIKLLLLMNINCVPILLDLNNIFIIGGIMFLFPNYLVISYIRLSIISIH